MADVILSPLVDAVIGALASPLVEDVRTMWQVDDDLDNLLDILSAIQFVLADAEERQIRDRSVKKWLGDLKVVAYDAEDVMDELAYEALRQNAEGETSNGKRRKVSSFLLSFSLFRSKPVLIQLDIKRRIKDINEKIDKITRNQERFCLREGDGGRLVMEHMLERPLTSSMMAIEVVGRAKEKEAIINLLVADDVPRRKHASVISIVGMGGLGKTTLAQLVYNDENVKKHFDVRAWVCVSPDFDIPRLTRETIESAAPHERCDWQAIDPLQCKLGQILSRKRSLIVLDDAWSEKCEDWETFQAPINVGARGSKILVTTRLEAVPRAMAMAKHHLYKLRPLANDDCLSLFLQHVFPDKDWDEYPELMKIGRELVRGRCQGLPLAAKALGGLLRDTREESYWESILKSPLWNSPDTTILPALSVSYHHLPPEIKQCFAFCSIFPKHLALNKDKLVRLWMAHGFITPKLEGKSAEDTGRDYIDCLLSRSFFQPRGSAAYAMHSCLHDLAESVSSTRFLEYEEGEPTEKPKKIDLRHLSVLFRSKNGLNLEHFYKYKGLRTFVFVDYFKTMWDRRILSDLFVNFECLRVLSLRSRGIEELPNSICNLKHLRYLDLSLTLIRQLPEVLTSLYHLQTLDLSYCTSLCQLPEGTSKLLNLRHLCLEGCPSLKTMPKNMGRLTCLQTLSRFVVGRESGCGIGELKKLRELKGAITISNLQNVENAEEAKEVNLAGIEELTLEWRRTWGWDGGDEDSVEQMEKVLEALQPSTKVKQLRIVGYGSVHFPSWFQGEMLPKLWHFTLQNSRRCLSCSNLGQLNMFEDITLSRMNGKKRLDEIKGFPSLKRLHISDMDNLEEWWCELGSGEIFPCLEYLLIENCPKLVKMPDCFSTIEELSLTDCPQLACLPKSASIDTLSMRNCKESLLREVPFLTSLSSLRIHNFNELTSLPEGLLQDLTNLKELVISFCHGLESLVQEERLQEKGLYPPLTSLIIDFCPNLRSLSKELQTLTSLEYLNIYDCPQLNSLSKEEFPTTLKRLTIRDSMEQFF